MWGWFLNLPWYFRYGVGMVVTGLGILAMIGGQPRIGGVALGVGAVMLLLASRSQAEKNGYRNY